MPRLDDFLGRWRVRRRIADRRTGETGRFLGQAQVFPAAEGVVHVEQGMLVLPGRPPMTASRRYLWSEARGRIVLRFADGRRFHEFDPRESAPEGAHSCGDDLYRVRYAFRRWPRWRTVWRVDGPRKDLVIVTAFAPLAPAAATRHNLRDGSME